MNRRQYLASSGAALTTLLAGCTATLSHTDQPDYAFTLQNGSRESHSFRVRVGNEAARTWFYEGSFEMDAETAAEDVPLDEPPARLFVTVDEAPEVERAWPASHSELGEIARRATIYYEPGQNQQLLVRA